MIKRVKRDMVKKRDERSLMWVPISFREYVRDRAIAENRTNVSIVDDILRCVKVFGKVKKK